MDVTLPQTWNTDASLEFTRTLDSVKDIPGVCLDFTKVEFAKPFGTLLIAECYKKFLAYRKSRSLRTQAVFPRDPAAVDGASGYLSHVGFYQYIGHSAGKAPGEARGSRKYVPIQVISRTDLLRASGNGPIQEAIERRSDELAGVIFTSIQEQNMMSYCLREVIRNVFEHAQIDSCTVMAQRYPYDGTAEIAIIDNGIGIHGSLCSTHQCGSVNDALRLALAPGASRVTGTQTGGRWDNSGYGLYILSTLGQQLGDFLILSNCRFLRLSARAERGCGGGAAFEGTGIRLKVNLRDAEYFPNLLRQIVTKGEEQAHSSPGSVSKASTSSKSLSMR